jgi:hypothetical protein
MGRERRCSMTERPGFLAMLQRIASNGVRLIRGQAREVRSGMPRGVAPAQFSIVKIRALWPLGEWRWQSTRYQSRLGGG